MFKTEISSKEIGKRSFEVGKFADELFPVIHGEVVKGAMRIRNNVIQSIARGTKSGRTYLWRGANPGEDPDSFMRSSLGHWFPVKFRNAPHKASAPGEPPATDEGGLIGSIAVDDRKNQIEVGSEMGAPYAEFLESGTRTMKPRPFLEPAVNKEASDIESNVMNAILKSASDIMK